MERSDNTNKQKIFDTDEEFDEFVEEVMWAHNDEWAMNREITKNFINHLFKVSSTEIEVYIILPQTIISVELTLI